MTGLHALWLPIVLSAVVVFILSSIIHMALPWHKGDFAKLPREDDVMSALRAFNLPPGDYLAPRPDSMADMKTSAFQEKNKQGPRFVMTVLPPGQLGMGSQMAQWFVFNLIVAVIAAYVTGRALAPGATYLQVFRFAGVTTFASYAFGQWQASIWYGKSWRTTMVSTFDSLLFGLFAAGVFGWLWPR
jgi:hypothetical protein